MESEINVKRVIEDYEINIANSQEYKSYINHVRGYKNYVFKEILNKSKFENEVKWLKELHNLKFQVPKLIGTYKQKIIITEKIDGNAIKDENAHKHLYNIGNMIANLHNINIKNNDVDWGKNIMTEYNELKNIGKEKVEANIYKQTIEFLDKQLENIKISDICIIHRDIRPENIIYSNGKYYILDFESMCIGDEDYDFTRMLNIFNQKDCYQYKDFEEFINGYKSARRFHYSSNKWKIYSKYYAFRMYTKMLTGSVNRDYEFESYLKNILLEKQDKISEWIERYNKKTY